MKFGVREICDVVFKAKSHVKIGAVDFMPGQPVLYIDTAKTSSLEGSATTVYAQGGKGNSKLLAWEGEKALTFTVEDALLSPIGFAVLAGTGIFNAAESHKVYVHKAVKAALGTDGVINLEDALESGEEISAKSPIFVATLEKGSISGMKTGFTVDTSKKSLTTTSKPSTTEDVFVDFYVEKTSGVTELVIDAGTFGGYYYVEASTLFKRESDGVDMPAEIIIPNVKVQSNFTFNMASTGDPSTFSFVMDAFPGYTRFDRTKKVLCAMQIYTDKGEGSAEQTSVDSANNSADDEIIYPIA